MNKLFTKDDILNYNKKYDDELTYEEVLKQVKEDINSGIEDLLENITQVKDRFYDRQNEFCDYLNVDSEIVSKEYFLSEILDRVEVKINYEGI